MKQRGRYCGRQYYVRACVIYCIQTRPPLCTFTNRVALTTDRYSVWLVLIHKRAILLLPLLCTTVVPVPLRGGPTVWQTKADSRKRQWAQAVCLYNDSRVLHHCPTHTPITQYKSRAGIPLHKQPRPNRVNAAESHYGDSGQML